MICDDFQFNGKWLSDFEMGTFDTDDSQNYPTRSIDKSEITSIRQTPNFYGVKYDDVLELNFLLIKDSDYITSKHRKLDSIEINKIKKWLELNKYGKLVCKNNAVIDNETININYYGVFTSVQPYLINGICYGIEATFTCNAPYGFSDDYVQSYVVNHSQQPSSANMVFDNKSSENEYLYPIIEVTTSSTCKLTIKNNSDKQSEMIVNITINNSANKIYIDCQKKKIYDEKGHIYTMSEIGLSTPSSSYYSFVSADAYMFYWLRFIQGENTLTIKFNDNKVDRVDIKTNYPIKGGGF